MSDTKKLPNLRILNEIHHRMGEVVRGEFSRWPRFLFMGRLEYNELRNCGLELYFSHVATTNYSDHSVQEIQEYVMGLQIVKVDRDEFMLVV